MLLKRDVSTQNLPWLHGIDLRLNTETNKLESVVNSDGKSGYRCDSAVRDYHIYQDIWEANYGELLSCTRETGNVFDPFAVCVSKAITDRVTWRPLTCALKRISKAPRKMVTRPVAGTDLPGMLTCCGLIFVGKEHTTKSTKIYTPRKFLRVRYASYCGLIFVDKRHTTKSTKAYILRKFLHIQYITTR